MPKKKAKGPVLALDGSFGNAVHDMIRDMELTATIIDAWPDEQEFTQMDMEILEDVRRAALQLARMAETVIREVRGLV